MKTGIRSKGTDGLLKLAVGICLLYALIRAGEFVYSRIPPYSEGTCLSTSSPFAVIQIKENHIIGGYSDVDLYVLIVKESIAASFIELRDPNLKKMECPK